MNEKQKAWARGWVRWVNFGGTAELTPEELTGYHDAEETSDKSAKRPTLLDAALEVDFDPSVIDDWTRGNGPALHARERFLAAIARPECTKAVAAIERDRRARVSQALDLLTETGALAGLDTLTRLLSACEDFRDLLRAKGDYRPTIYTKPRSGRAADVALAAQMKVLADSYDGFQAALGDPRRAFRGGGP